MEKHAGISHAEQQKNYILRKVNSSLMAFQLETRESFAKLRGEMAESTATTRGEIAELSAAIRGDMKESFATLRGDMKAGRMADRVGWLMMAATLLGVMAKAFKWI